MIAVASVGYPTRIALPPSRCLPSVFQPALAYDLFRFLRGPLYGDGEAQPERVAGRKESSIVVDRIEELWRPTSVKEVWPETFSRAARWQ